MVKFHPLLAMNVASSIIVAIQFFVSLIPSLFLLIIILTIYSFSVNIIFGHPTYWKRWVQSLHFSLKILSSKFFIIAEQIHYFSLGDSTNLFTLFLELRRLTNYKINSSYTLSSSDVVNESTCSKHKRQCFLLQTLDENILLNICMYLHPYDNIVLTTVSKSMKYICQSRILWEFQIDRLVNKARIIEGFDDKVFYSTNFQLDQRFSCRHRFFLLYIQLVNYLLNYRVNGATQQGSQVIRVTIHGSLYDLTDFAYEHPGGQSILTEWRGQVN